MIAIFATTVTASVGLVLSQFVLDRAGVLPRAARAGASYVAAWLDDDSWHAEQLRDIREYNVPLFVAAHEARRIDHVRPDVIAAQRRLDAEIRTVIDSLFAPARDRVGAAA